MAGLRGYESEARESELPGTSYYVRSQDHDLVSALRSDKEALKAALKTAVTQRDELLGKLKSEEKTGGKRDLEQENAQLRKDVAELVRTAEDYRARLSSAKSIEQRTKELEEEVRKLGSRHSKHSRQPSGSLSDLQRYAHFVVEKVKAVPELKNLFRGRIGSGRRYLRGVDEGLYQDCLLKMLQLMSDLLVFYEEKKGMNSKGMQTLSEQGTNTGPFEAEKDLFLPFNRPKPRETPTRSLASPLESCISPTSRSGLSLSSRNGSDYERLMEESEQLLTSIHFQNDRLQRLNSQIHTTVHGPYTSFSQRPRGSDVRKPILTIPLSPSSALEPVQESLHLDELSSGKQSPATNSEYESVSATPRADVTADEKQQRKSTLSVPKMRPVDKKAGAIRKPLRKNEEMPASRITPNRKIS